MFLKINEEKEILSFAVVGEIAGGLQVPENTKIPSDFEPKKYKFEDDKIVVNLDFLPKKHDATEDNTIESMKALNARLTLALAELTNEVILMKGGA
ncbi:hypothetical protein AWJ00_08180 [Listeria monocytogenes]|uniref:DUF2977 domain-containing protein n=1 Tax=Listeria monocytogenes TaxID=1639 RepID=UPI000775B114|nr:DUF2977 domain-containing protein [Listeria monocytogenes]EKZ4877810.1 DUF2977 domain-containing protein [Listeria monocytogenes]KXS65743.1 hypothetical protein AWJ02_01425 [Listeria monocytogenes]KXW92898.1 hypothetical protein AWJ00_08180 [Listeria monocytogenes]